MNASRLKELTDLLMGVEGQFGVQDILVKISSDLEQMIGNPTHAAFQTNFSQNFDRFRTLWRQMTESFSPAQTKLLAEIGATGYFLDDVPSQIEDVIKNNNVTPAVIREKVESFRGSREQYLTTVSELGARLKAVGIEAYQLEAGSAELGLLLPREMFGNELGGLINELRALNRIIRAFSEMAIGHAEPVEVHQISTSDPVFFLGIAPETVALLAGAITWAISTWKAVEEIRKVRAETLKLKSFTPEEVDKIFSKKMENQIAIAVDEKVDELIKISDEAGRHHEQRINLEWALQSILGRVERGMTVEVRFLPPPQPNEGEAMPASAQAFETLRGVAPQLKFPASDPNPVLALPPPEPPSEQSGTPLAGAS